MIGTEQRLRLRAPSPALRRARVDAAAPSTASVRRRIGWIWGLLFLNVLPYYFRSPVLHLPVSLGKVITQGALAVALVLAVSVNRRVLVRSNLFLVLMSLLCVTSVMMSVHGYFGFGSILRAGRLVMFVAVLWLLTPWWGRSDLFLLRFHRRALAAVLGIVLLGLAVLPGHALGQAGGDRLGGVIWPIPPTQVAHYAALFTGITVVLWFAGMVRPRIAVAAIVTGMAMLLLTHTRTAVVALLVGVLVAALSLFASRRRVRKAFAVTVVVAALVALTFAPFLASWFGRGQSGQELTNLSGRQTVWSAVAAQPRSELNTVFGFGMSNDGFDGLSIDSSWYSTYLDQGLFGDVVDASVLLLLLLIAAFRPRGPGRALALFLVVYCAIASVTETGLGEASPYLLDLAVAMSLLMSPLTEPDALTPVQPGYDV
ncbi:MAG: O-antigen ligase domain-containing protein [Acidimicrobiales bacterium]